MDFIIGKQIICKRKLIVSKDNARFSMNVGDKFIISGFHSVNKLYDVGNGIISFKFKIDEMMIFFITMHERRNLIIEDIINDL